MNAIHFASLFCVDYDMDLSHAWSEHYMKFGFDDYRIWLHSPSNNNMLLNQARRLFNIKGFKVEFVGKQDFADGKLRERVLENYRRSLPLNDYLVTADSDEFQIVDNYREKIHNYDMVIGQLIDRYDATLHRARPGVTLGSQFPFRGNVETEVFKTLPENSKVYWPYVNKEKILASKVDLPVALGGSHMLMNMVRDIHFSSYHTVEHYTWRDTILERMSRKGYYQGWQIWYVQKFFGIEEVSDVLLRMEQEEAEIQKLKGWIPCQSVAC